jgi:hypothetical protein
MYRMDSSNLRGLINYYRTYRAPAYNESMGARPDVYVRWQNEYTTSALGLHQCEPCGQAE